MVKRGNKRLVTPRFLLLALLFAVIGFILYIQFNEFFVDFWPDKKKIEKSRRELAAKHEELQKLLNEHQKIKMNHEAFIKYGKRFWIEKRDGKVETMAQRRIEQAAKDVSLNLDRLGRAQSQKIMEGVYSVEITFSAKAPIAQLGKFIYQLYNTNPRFYWSRVTFRPDSLRKPTSVLLNGSVRFVEITDPEIVSLILGSN